MAASSGDPYTQANTVVELREACGMYGLAKTGNKATLLTRLQDHIASLGTGPRFAGLNSALPALAEAAEEDQATSDAESAEETEVCCAAKALSRHSVGSSTRGQYSILGFSSIEYSWTVLGTRYSKVLE